MAEKKVAKKNTKKTTKISKAKSTKSKGKKIRDEPSENSGIVIVDDDIVIDQDQVNEERRAYREEARSQEATDSKSLSYSVTYWIYACIMFDYS